MIETGVMSVGDVVGIIGLFAALLGSTWHLSAKLQTIVSNQNAAKVLLDAHIVDYRVELLELKRRISALEAGHVARPLEVA